MKGRPVLGALSGLLLGVFVAVELQQFGLRPLDTFSVVGMPLIGVVLGLVMAGVAPFGGGSTDG